jgi:hypothetical protein
VRLRTAARGAPKARPRGATAAPVRLFIRVAERSPFFSAPHPRHRRALPQFLFSATFALSANMLLLAIYEIVGLLEPAARWLTWRLVLVAITLDLVSGAGRVGRGKGEAACG